MYVRYFQNYKLPIHLVNNNSNYKKKKKKKCT